MYIAYKAQSNTSCYRLPVSHIICNSEYFLLFTRLGQGYGALNAALIIEKNSCDFSYIYFADTLPPLTKKFSRLYSTGAVLVSR